MGHTLTKIINTLRYANSILILIKKVQGVFFSSYTLDKSWHCSSHTVYVFMYTWNMYMYISICPLSVHGSACKTLSRHAKLVLCLCSYKSQMTFKHQILLTFKAFLWWQIQDYIFWSLCIWGPQFYGMALQQADKQSGTRRNTHTHQQHNEATHMIEVTAVLLPIKAEWAGERASES